MVTYTRLTDFDYDEKLREMGNYLWDLEQQADVAGLEGDPTLVDEIEKKILRQAERARSFLEIPGTHQVLAACVAGLGPEEARVPSDPRRRTRQSRIPHEPTDARRDE